MSKERVIITGCNGFLGRALLRTLSDSKFEIFGIDNELSGSSRLSPEDMKSMHFHKADIRDSSFISKLIKEIKPTSLIHLAAIHFIPRCEKDPEEAISTNILGTVNLVNSLDSGTNLIFASTGAIYSPSLLPHREEDEALPQDIYGFTKLHCEQYISYISNIKRLNTTTLRLFNLVGEGETNPHLLPDIFSQISLGLRDISLGNISPKRDYINIRDVTSLILNILNSKEKNEGVNTFNIGSGKSFSVEEIILKISQILGEKISINIDNNKLRKVDRPNLCSNNSKASDFFDWKPIISIEDTIKELLK